MSQQSEKINQENEKNIIKTVISVGFVIICSLIIIYTACFKLNNILFGLNLLGQKCLRFRKSQFLSNLSIFCFLSHKYSKNIMDSNIDLYFN